MRSDQANLQNDEKNPQLFTVEHFGISLTSLGQEPQKTPDLTEAAALNETVVKLFNEKKYREALPLALRALEIQERLLPADDERIEVALKRVGDVQFATNDLNAAKDTYNRLLQKQVLRVGTDDLLLASTFDRLAVIYFRENSDRDAQNASTRALTIREAKLGPNHPDVAQTLYGLGEQFRMRGQSQQRHCHSTCAHSQFMRSTQASIVPSLKKLVRVSCVRYTSLEDGTCYKDLIEIRKRYTPKTDRY